MHGVGLSSTSLITTRIIRVLYVLILLLIGLFAVATLIGILVSGDATAIGKLLALVLIPVGAFIYVLWSRVALEVVIALFRTMENTGEAARLLREGAGPVGAAAGLPAAAPARVEGRQQQRL